MRMTSAEVLKNFTIDNMFEIDEGDPHSTFIKRLSLLNSISKLFHLGQTPRVVKRLYKTKRWRRIRSIVLHRDGYFDLGVNDIFYKVDSPLIHHIIPVCPLSIRTLGIDYFFDPNYLITTKPKTHHIIHEGVVNKKELSTFPRRDGDVFDFNTIDLSELKERLK